MTFLMLRAAVRVDQPLALALARSVRVDQALALVIARSVRVDQALALAIARSIRRTQPSRPISARQSNSPGPPPTPVTATRTAWTMSPRPEPRSASQRLRVPAPATARRRRRAPPARRGRRRGARRRPAPARAWRRPCRRRSTSSPKKNARLQQDVAEHLDAIAERLDDARDPRARFGDVGPATSPRARGTGARAATFSASGSALHVVLLERQQLGRIEAGRRLVHALEREVLDHLRARQELGLVVERPAEQHQVVDDRVGQVADLLVEIDDHRVERLGRGRAGPSPRRSPGRARGPCAKSGFFRYLSSLRLRQLVLAARLGDVRQVGVLRAADSRAPAAMKICRGVFDRCSSARMTCVISKS